MPRLLVSRRAKADLAELWTYIARDSPAAADRMMAEIEERLAMLAGSPLLGPARPDIAEGLRLFPVRRYVVLYRALSDGVAIIRVVHGMRRLRDLA